ncbi:lasso RiPP family leader peptide-containing protein [Thermoactinospora rubra]
MDQNVVHELCKEIYEPPIVVDAGDFAKQTRGLTHFNREIVWGRMGG